VWFSIGDPLQLLTFSYAVCIFDHLTPMRSGPSGRGGSGVSTTVAPPGAFASCPTKSGRGATGGACQTAAAAALVSSATWRRALHQECWPRTKRTHIGAHQGVKPILLKSFYSKAGGLIRQNASWAAEHYYAKSLARGYDQQNRGFFGSRGASRLAPSAS
jgi:hypothetical protein